MANQTALAKPAQGVPLLRDLLDKSKEQIALALPKHMTAERMIRVAITAVQRQPKLLECSPLSVVGCVIQAAQLGLEPDGILGEAYMVPYWNSKSKHMEAQLQAGYRGLINLARRSGQVSVVYAEPVFECDYFKVLLGTHHTIEHIPNYDDVTRGTLDESGNLLGLRGCYAVVKFKDGTDDFEYMSLHQLNQIRASSKSKDKDGNEYGPWATHPSEMYRKTPIRRLAKRLPLSPEFQKAAILDEYAEAGVGPAMSLNVDPHSASARMATDSAMAQLKERYVKPEDENQEAGPTQEEETQDPQQVTASAPTPSPEAIAGQEKLEKQRKSGTDTGMQGVQLEGKF